MISDVVMGESLQFCSICIHKEQFRRGLYLVLVHISRKGDFCAIGGPAGVIVFRRGIVCESASAGAIIVHDINVTVHTKDDFRINADCRPGEQ